MFEPLLSNTDMRPFLHAGRTSRPARLLEGVATMAMKPTTPTNKPAPTAGAKPAPKPAPKPTNKGK